MGPPGPSGVASFGHALFPHQPMGGGTWTPIFLNMGSLVSTIDFTSPGGAMLITIDAQINGDPGDWVACRPMIDGVWAGTYGGLSIQANAHFSAYEGFLDLGPSPSVGRWRSTRVYPGIPAGNHTLEVRCYSAEVALMSTNINNFTTPSWVQFVVLKP